MILEFDDGVNDEGAFFKACEKLKVSGVWEAAMKKYGIAPSVSSSSKPGKVPPEKPLGGELREKRSF
jgi:hypothetical protein